ncbi:DUF5689 domain-containing protein [Aureivirga sp. CE67]|uniref:DUF5689 domain-containing protein n=1 Tax=Aureivirga sp. CE67 TaxID=1788983 RepID=UPI0018CB09DF|nr:DUF5689 domain-containing protein [Aureivirga sp. CE67]
MKKLFLLLSIGCLLAVFQTSCVNDDDYSIPNIVDPSIDIKPNITLDGVKQMYTGSLIEFGADSDLIFEAYVVSSDETGNIYKVMYLQDDPTDPTQGIAISIDATNTYVKYNVGRKVYVKLAGLYMNALNGVLTIGGLNGSNVGRISEFTYEDHLVRTPETMMVTPKLITSADFSPAIHSMLVKLEDYQLIETQLGDAYANYDNTFSVNRTLVSCSGGENVVMRNSGFATFKSQTFPEGRGSVVAVFSAYNSTNQLFIRSTEDVQFEGTRCKALFEENFSSVTDNQKIELPGWINFTQAGTRDWNGGEFNDDKYAKFSPFGANEPENIGWLITPAIDLNETTDPLLTFESATAYPVDGFQPLEILVSTDFDGTEAGIPNATWNVLNATLAGPGNSNFEVVPSGEVSLASNISDQVYIAYRYTGNSADNQSPLMQIYNIKVFEK